MVDLHEKTGQDKEAPFYSNLDFYQTLDFYVEKKKFGFLISFRSIKTSYMQDIKEKIKIRKQQQKRCIFEPNLCF